MGLSHSATAQPNYPCLLLSLFIIGAVDARAASMASIATRRPSHAPLMYKAGVANAPANPSSFPSPRSHALGVFPVAREMAVIAAAHPRGHRPRTASEACPGGLPSSATAPAPPDWSREPPSISPTSSSSSNHRRRSL